MDFLIGKLASFGLDFYAYGTFAIAALFILRRIPNDKIQAFLAPIAYYAGVASTGGMSKWKYTRKIWNKFIEAYFIDAIENFIVFPINEYIRGLRSDN